MTESLGQQLVIDNRSGAGGTVAAHTLATAPPDGYTIGFAGSNNAINATLYAKLPFDFMRDSAPVAGTVRLTNVVVVHPSFPAQNIAEFIAHAKANPGKMNYGGLGIGQSGHLSMELLKTMTGIDVVYVPYKSIGLVVTDLLAGRNLTRPRAPRADRARSRLCRAHPDRRNPRRPACGY